MATGQASRNIMMLLAFTMAFSVVGYERANMLHGQNPSNPAPVGPNPATILLGGTVGGILLIGVSHAGDAGAQFAQGLAIVAAATAILVNGGPVWSLISSLYGTSKPTTPTPTITATTPTIPTGG